MNRRVNNLSAMDRFVGRFAAEKKKTVFALCLIAVMGSMWLKVLTGRGPKSASASYTAVDSTAEGQEQQLKISYIELPRVEGRNDELSRDFFRLSKWRDLLAGNPTTAQEVDVISEDASEEFGKQIAQKLKLEAIELGAAPRAFINGKLVGVGEKLFVGGKANKYECKVIEIEENKVIIRCRKAQITLKLIQQREVRY